MASSTPQEPSRLETALLQSGLSDRSDRSKLLSPRALLGPVAWLTCVCALFLSWGVARAALPPRGADEPVAVRFPETHGRVTISPSVQAERVYESDDATGRISILAGTLDFLLRVAYGVHPRDIVFETRLNRRALYDVVALPADHSRTSAIEMLRLQLATRFGFDASFERRLVPVYLMKRIDGAAVPQPSTAVKRRVTGGRGRFSGRRASMRDLARFARTLTRKPVVDASELTGVYDVAMRWDPSAGRRGFRNALAALGLELVDGQREVKQLIVRQAPDTPDSKPGAP